MQRNAEVPTGNDEPDGGSQLVRTGGVPPSVVGVSVTGNVVPGGAVSTGAGQITVKVSTVQTNSGVGGPSRSSEV
jgi:hypothetical protein